VGRARRQLVLVVEDDPDLGDTIVTFLKEEGLDAKLARDGDQAMRLLDQLNPSAMILDLMMPRRDGLQVLRELRDSPDFAETPVIVLTAQPAKREEALEAGATIVMDKPFTPDDISAAVEEVLTPKG